MGKVHQINHEEALKRIDVKSDGDLQASECRAMIVGLSEKCAAARIETILIDHTDGSMQHLMHGEMRGIAQSCETLNEPFAEGKFALVVARDVDFGLARMWMTLTEGNLTYERQIFRSREAALAWLDTPLVA